MYLTVYPYSFMNTYTNKFSVSRIAYNKDAGEAFGNFSGLDPLNLPKATKPAASLVVSNPETDELRRELRKIILEELNAVLAA